MADREAPRLFAIMVEGNAPADRSEDVSVDAPDTTPWFVDWLSEVLFLFDARGFVPREIEIDVEPCFVRGRLLGTGAQLFSQSGPGVKAVTYHEALVEQTPAGWEARVYLDV